MALLSVLLPLFLLAKFEALVLSKENDESPISENDESPGSPFLSMSVSSHPHRELSGSCGGLDTKHKNKDKCGHKKNCIYGICALGYKQCHGGSNEGQWCRSFGTGVKWCYGWLCPWWRGKCVYKKCRHLKCGATNAPRKNGDECSYQEWMEHQNSPKGRCDKGKCLLKGTWKQKHSCGGDKTKGQNGNACVTAKWRWGRCEYGNCVLGNGESRYGVADKCSSATNGEECRNYGTGVKWCYGPACPWWIGVCVNSKCVWPKCGNRYRFENNGDECKVEEWKNSPKGKCDKGVCVTKENWKGGCGADKTKGQNGNACVTAKNRWGRCEYGNCVLGKDADKCSSATNGEECRNYGTGVKSCYGFLCPWWIGVCVNSKCPWPKCGNRYRFENYGDECKMVPWKDSAKGRCDKGGCVLKENWKGGCGKDKTDDEDDNVCVTAKNLWGRCEYGNCVLGKDADKCGPATNGEECRNYGTGVKSCYGPACPWWIGICVNSKCPWPDCGNRYNSKNEDQKCRAEPWKGKTQDGYCLEGNCLKQCEPLGDTCWGEGVCLDKACAPENCAWFIGQKHEGEWCDVEPWNVNSERGRCELANLGLCVNKSRAFDFCGVRGVGADAKKGNDHENQRCMIERGGKQYFSKCKWGVCPVLDCTKPESGEDLNGLYCIDLEGLAQGVGICINEECVASPFCGMWHTPKNDGQACELGTTQPGRCNKGTCGVVMAAAQAPLSVAQGPSSFPTAPVSLPAPGQSAPVAPGAIPPPVAPGDAACGGFDDGGGEEAVFYVCPAESMRARKTLIFVVLESVL